MSFAIPKISPLHLSNLHLSIRSNEPQISLAS